MRPSLKKLSARVRPTHPYAWLWEPLEADPGFVLRPMFGGKCAYLDGRLTLFFVAKREPWRGLLVCTDRDRHAALQQEFAGLQPHPVLSKWLFLSEDDDGFERTARQLVALARRRDPRLGVEPQPKKSRSAPGKRSRTKPPPPAPSGVALTRERPGKHP